MSHDIPPLIYSIHLVYYCKHGYPLTYTLPDCSVVSLFPNYGNVLGGQPVTVSGPCFKETDVISCLFDGVETRAVFIEKFEVLCVSPALSQPGRTTFELAINRRVIGETIFISCKLRVAVLLRCRIRIASFCVCGDSF